MRESVAWYHRISNNAMRRDKLLLHAKRPRLARWGQQAGTPEQVCYGALQLYERGGSGGAPGDDNDVPAGTDRKLPHDSAQAAPDPVTDHGRADALSDGEAITVGLPLTRAGFHDQELARPGTSTAVDGGKVRSPP